MSLNSYRVQDIFRDNFRDTYRDCIELHPRSAAERDCYHDAHCSGENSCDLIIYQTESTNL